MSQSQSGRYSGPPPEETAIITAPVPRYYALLVGVLLTALGVLGLIPAFTQGHLLLNVMHITLSDALVYLITGLAGLVVWLLNRGRYARAYAIALAAIYFVVFSIGNITFGNQGLAQGLHQDIAWIIANGLQVSLMLFSALVAALGDMQIGDRRTREVNARRRIDYRSRTRLPS